LRDRIAARSPTSVALPWLRLAFCALAALAFESEAQVYRCGNTYSNVPCAGGKEVDTSPTLSWGQTKGGTATLYLCQAYGGGQFWTREHCRQRDALVERMESVPGGMPFEQQVELARDRLAQSRRSADMSSSAPGQRMAPATNVSASSCKFLDERIRQLDAMARAGGHAGYMDWIALERKDARDRQFRLRC
jgi:hypothetical protein